MSLSTPPAPAFAAGDLDTTKPKVYPDRWRMSRAGIINVWHYYDEMFEFSGGRVVLRGTNGAGKSRALEMLLPFVLDANRRRMDATGAGTVSLGDLMKAGSDGQPNRHGYLWVELVRRTQDGPGTDTAQEQYLTLGVRVKWSAATAKAADPVYFMTDLRVGAELPLLDQGRHPLPKDTLAELIGADRITDSAQTHRERAGAAVFTLEGENGAERYDGFLNLLHTLRSPDVGNRIDKGALPAILSEALPPLSEDSLKDSGAHLDSLSESRDAQLRLSGALARVNTFLSAYRLYAGDTLADAATSARRGAAGASAARREQAAKVKARDALAADAAAEAGRVLTLAAQVDKLAAQIQGIMVSPAYAAGVNIDNLARSVSALADAADSALGAAAASREQEADAVARIDAAAGDVLQAATTAAARLQEAAALLGQAKLGTGAMPAAVTASVAPGVAALAAVRAGRDAEPAPAPRPTPATLSVEPTDTVGAGGGIAAAAAAALARAGEAGNRRDSAIKLAAGRAKLTRDEERAEEAAGGANTALGVADALAEARDQAGVVLATSWATWAASPATAAHLGQVRWAATPIGALLGDPDILTGTHDGPAGRADHSEAPALPFLDRVAQEAAGGARARLADAGAALNAAARDDDAQRGALSAEATSLRAAQDPPPPAPPWVAATPGPGVPLWESIDFAPELSAQARAGLEAALLAAGLLGAQLCADGSVRAQAGQVLLTADSPVAVRALSAALRPDPAGRAPAALVAATLARVGLGEAGHDTWVDVDGSWGNGPLRGRHTVDAAAHIGASARAAAREQRLAQIDAELDAIDARAAARANQRDQLARAGAELDAHLATAPTSAHLALARSRAGDADAVATRAAVVAADLGRAAALARTAWVGAAREHAERCDHLGLPHEPDDLAQVERCARDAARACQDSAGALSEMGRRATRHRDALGALGALSRRRADSENAAELAWGNWDSAAGQFAALVANAGAQAEQVRANLAKAEREHDDAKTELAAARVSAAELGSAAAVAASAALGAADAVGSAAEVMATAYAELGRRVRLPGLVSAAVTGAGTDLAGACTPTPGAQLAPGVVEAAAAVVLDAVGPRSASGGADENAIIRAQQILERELSGTFDVIATIEAGVRLLELSDATGRQPVAEAGARLDAEAAAGAAALTSQEYKVFTDFVLGGVGDELRRRLGRARTLVEAMNASLADIHTSHGISVLLKWNLTGDPASPVARIRELVTASNEVRPAAQTRELVSLLKDRVAAQFAADPTLGYTTHLRDALDYRLWHEVEVWVLGPARGQKRRLTQRMKLSQGETRFVSYVTLFAAVDAYLSGLPDTSRALRLILLDDAFAKVDDQTIGELMGLLVRLDIDFALTGHALWGTYPQVPSLDVYEVVRGEGTPAVTTHIHWDGRNRHLRSAR